MKFLLIAVAVFVSDADVYSYVDNRFFYQSHEQCMESRDYFVRYAEKKYNLYHKSVPSNVEAWCITSTGNPHYILNQEAD